MNNPTVNCSNCNLDLSNVRGEARVVKYEDSARIKVDINCPLCYTNHMALVMPEEMVNDNSQSLSENH